MVKRILYGVAALLMAAACTPRHTEPQREYVYIKNGQFIRHGRPYYYVGANFWYGAILASEGTGGNRVRLTHELDSLKAIGVDNLRILVGSDGRRGVPTKVEPTLQISPGVYNDTILAGLDYLLSEMGKRDMLAVLYLNNSWEWSGGYSQYLEWAGYGKAPVPKIDSWPAYMDYVKQFVKADSAKHLFARYVEDIVTRTNRYTHRKYTDDPTIMSWQIGNEPRAFSTENKPAFAQWIKEVAVQIKSLDANHLVSTGNEGEQGCEQDISLFEQIHAYPEVDYLTIHIWPYNWGWAKKDSLQENLPQAIANTGDYITRHLEVAKKYTKPLVIEEFGYPRDGFGFKKEIPTRARDAFYGYVFDRIRQEAQVNAFLAGCNFWAWGGSARLSDQHIFWEYGDDYTGDPAQEEQGLNSVFATDISTASLIRDTNRQLAK